MGAPAGAFQSQTKRPVTQSVVCPFTFPALPSPAGPRRRVLPLPLHTLQGRTNESLPALQVYLCRVECVPRGHTTLITLLRGGRSPSAHSAAAEALSPGRASSRRHCDQQLIWTRECRRRRLREGDSAGGRKGDSKKEEEDGTEKEA